MDLFPGLPDDIGLQCLLRVPLTSHTKLKMVSRKWNAVVGSPKFYEDRKLLKMSEHHICFALDRDDNPSDCDPIEVILYDPTNGVGERLPPLPPPFKIPFAAQCLSVSHKLFFIGGMKFDDTVVNTVFMYDICSCRWFRRSDMPTQRVWFACSVSPRGLIYVAGGMDKNLNPLRDAAVYDPREDKWDLLSPMNTPKGACSGTFIYHKFFVVSCREGHREISNAEVYDTDTRRWATMEILRGIETICMVPFHGQLYFFENDGVLEYDCQENMCRLVEPLPTDVHEVVSATVYGDKIFVTAFEEYGNNLIFYLFIPPNSQGRVAQKWIPMDRFMTYVVSSAAALEI